MKRKTMKQVGAGILAAAMTVTTVFMPTDMVRAADTKTSMTGTYSSGTDKQWEALPTVDFETPTAANQDLDSIVIDASQRYQKYTGVGISLDETSIANLWDGRSKEQVEEIVKKMVDSQTGAGMNLFRITIGSPDCIQHVPFWSYDDMPAGEEDWNLEHFSIQKDIDAHIIDTIKIIQQYNPHAEFFGTAWSAPGWMKTKDRFTGYVEQNPDGSYTQTNALRDDCIEVFAKYYVRFLQAYQEQGIQVSAITLLNEPGIDVIYPAMALSIEQQQKLALEIKKQFKEAGFTTKLWAHDFNFWDWKDPASTETKNYYRIMENEEVKAAFDGIGFHPYWGDASVMGDAYQEYDKNVYLTEAPHMEPFAMIEDFNNYASAYVGWCMITDQYGGKLHWTNSHDNDYDFENASMKNGWTNRLLVHNDETKEMSYVSSFYATGQVTKYVKEGAVRVASSQSALANTAFENSDGSMAVVVYNPGEARKIKLSMFGKEAVQTIPGYSYATLMFTPETEKANNTAPVITDIKDQTAYQRTELKFQITASDAEGDLLSYSATDLPAGSKVNSSTGEVTFKSSTVGTFTITVNASDGFKSASKTVKIEVLPKTRSITDRVEAEEYDEQSGWTNMSQFIENTAGVSGGKNVGYTSAGNWLAYRVNVEKRGLYKVVFNAANGNGSDSTDCLSVRNEKGDSLAVVSVKATGGWTNYTTVEAEGVMLEAGEQTIKLYCDKGGFNLDYADFTLTKDMTEKPVAKTLEQVTADRLADEVYCMKDITPAVKNVKDGTTVLKQDQDYKVSYQNNRNVGTASVILTGMGAYTGTKTFTFKIVAKEISKVQIGTIKDVKYTGKTIKPAVNVTDAAQALKAGQDYTVSYKNNKAAGTASVTVTGIGNYSGTKLLQFKIVKVAKVTGLKVKKASKSKLKISWSKAKNVSGYAIYMKTGKNGAYKLVKKLSGSSKVSYTKSGVKAKKTYYVKVRAYTKSGSTTFYGDYSKTVKIKR